MEAIAEQNTDLATMLDGAGGLVSTEDSAQFLTFFLAGEEYGIDILKVREIKGWTPVTRVPNTPDYVQGVLNLRGTIVPIIDMRRRFNLEEEEYTKITVVIVVMIQDGDRQRVVGIVVDAVSDVLNTQAKDIKPAPDFGTAVHTEFISGLAATDDSMVMLLDIDRLLTAEEVAKLNQLADEE